MWCVLCLFSALSCRVGALQVSIIIIITGFIIIASWMCLIFMCLWWQLCAASSGIGDGDLAKLSQILEAVPEISYVCIDVANGYSEHFVQFVRDVRRKYPNHTIMVSVIWSLRFWGVVGALVGVGSRWQCWACVGGWRGVFGVVHRCWCLSRCWVRVTVLSLCGWVGVGVLHRCWGLSRCWIRVKVFSLCGWVGVGVLHRCWGLSRCWIRVKVLSWGGRSVWCCAQVLEPK